MYYKVVDIIGREKNISLLLFFATLGKGLHDMSRHCVFARRRASGQISDTAAMFFTRRASEFHMRKHVALIQRQESFHLHRQRGIAAIVLQNVIEQVMAGFNFFKVGLKPDQANKAVVQKIVSGLPDVITF
jgi:hypothetical protein